MLLVGTHKDELQDVDAELKEAQRLLTKFLNAGSLIKRILQNIQQPDDKSGNKRWFFAVDSKSRQTSARREVCKDPVIDDIRRKLEQVAMEDARTVKGSCVHGNSDGAYTVRMRTLCMHCIIIPFLTCVCVTQV